MKGGSLAAPPVTGALAASGRFAILPLVTETGDAVPRFKIGAEIVCGDGRFRCTNLGTRVVVAIRVDEVSVVQVEDGERRTSTVSGAEAAADGWFNGPPYAVAETVFDEHDQEACEPA